MGTAAGPVGGALLPSSEIYLGTAAGSVCGALLPSSEIYLGTSAGPVGGALLPSSEIRVRVRLLRVRVLQPALLVERCCHLAKYIWVLQTLRVSAAAI